VRGKENRGKGEETRETGEAKTEGKVWELIRRKRKRWKRVNEEIKMEEWKEHFLRLLGGSKGR